MNILIKNMSNTYNYGSMMMGENLITYLLERCNKNINFYIDADSVEHLDRLREATEYQNIFLDKIFKYTIKTKKIPIIRRYERKIKEYLSMKKCKKMYDVVFILGGDDFSELYYDIEKESKHVLNLLNNINDLNYSTNLFMLGQTIGPYTGERLEKAKEVFRRVNLYTRDDVNYNYMKNVMNCTPNKMRDLAFLDLHLQSKYEDKFQEILKEYNLKDNEYIILIGTGLMHHYNTNIDEVVEKTVDFIKIVEQQCPTKKIVWLSHVVGNTKSDNDMLNKIKSKYSSIYKKMTIVNDVMLPARARIILGHAYFNISFRMHSAVSTFQMGKPCICLSYSPKYGGVIGDSLDMKELVIESRNPELWSTKNQTLDMLLKSRIDYIEKNYKNIVLQIKLKVAECKDINYKVLETIGTEVKKNV